MSPRPRAWAAAGLVVLAGAGLTACEPALSEEAGVVVSVDSPALGRVDSFQLLTKTGDILTFDTSQLRFQPDFPAAHLSEHQVAGEPIQVTYRTDGDRLVVTRLDDG